MTTFITHNDSDPPIERSIIERVFIAFIVYYWSLQFTRGDSVEMFSLDFGYYLYVIPAGLLAITGILYLVFFERQLRRTPVILMAFLLILAALSFARSDLRTIVSLGLLSVTLMFIFQVRPKLPLELINWLFIISIPINTLLFYNEYSLYTFIPGLNLDTNLWWRVAMFPSIAESGLFSMTVFMMNLTLRSKPGRGVMLVLSGYFMLLSGNRTALAAAVLIMMYYSLRWIGLLVTTRGRVIFSVASLGLFILAISGSSIFLSLDSDGILRTLVLRDEAVGSFDVGDQVGTAAIRQWIFQQHLEAFRGSPWVGIGSFNLQMLNSGVGVLDDRISGSEAFLTGLLARIGLVSILLFVAIFAVRQPTRETDLSVSAKLALMVGMITYGSFVAVYDVVFLILLLAIAGTIYPSTYASKPRLGTS